MRLLTCQRHSLPLALVLLALAGCAAPAGSAAPTNAPITQEELQESAAPTIVAAVRDLRPQWLSRLKGAFLDGFPVSVRQLQRESLSGVAEIRLLTAEQATARYGTRSLSGLYLDVVRQW